MQLTSGNVLRVEKTSIHDGDGLRTVFFLKGCSLRCLWCSTPESQSPDPEVGYNREKCVMCGACVESCPNGAISIDGIGARIRRDRSRCVGCFLCVLKCPSSAMKGYGTRMTSEDAVREIAKDEVFYFHSGGGVTISGGEPLNQAEFVREILIGCEKLGIHRAMETSFFAEWENIEKLLPHINLVYVDLKHPMPEEHRRAVGVDNKIILDNIRRADESPHDFRLIARTPLIPGINDSDEAISESARFLKGLRKIRAMEFLAYHRLGLETYRSLGIDYPLGEIEIPSAEYMAEKARSFQRIFGKPVIINGMPLRTP